MVECFSWKKVQKRSVLKLKYRIKLLEKQGNGNAVMHDKAVLKKLEHRMESNG